MFHETLQRCPPRSRVTNIGRNLCGILLVAGSALHPLLAASPSDSLAAALAGSQRTDAERARDKYRHPEQTLDFFQVKATDSVVEIEPGGGWYTAILAPYLQQNGHYYAAPYVTGSPKAAPEEAQDLSLLQKRLGTDASIYGHVTIGTLKGGHITGVGAPGTINAVLTFRNLHNWAEDGHVDDNLHAFYEALKPGGVLGVVDHRANPGTSFDVMVKSGYMTEDYVIEHAKAAGFVLEASSPINDNARDTKNYPDGVWDLPPALRSGTTDREKYLGIGESDRMTLRFRKPLNP